MFVSSVYSDLKQIFASCTEAEIFRRTTDAVKAISDTGIVDINLAWMDICVCDGCITLPRDVGTVLGVNVGGAPTLINNQWFQYHINGPGSGCVPCGYSEEMGEVVTYKDPSGPVKLIAVVENASDNNTLLRVFGWDENGKRIYTEGAGGVLEDGFLVPTIYGFFQPNPDAPSISRIDRIHKEACNGFIRLLAIDPDDSTVQTQIGYYEPTETVPSYRRLRVPNKSWVRLKYKRKNYEITSQSDFINMDNRMALLMACRSIHFLMRDRYQDSKAAMDQAILLLNNEASSQRPSGPVVPQVITDVYGEGSPNLIYDTAGGLGYIGPNGYYTG